MFWRVGAIATAASYSAASFCVPKAEIASGMKALEAILSQVA